MIPCLLDMVTGMLISPMMDMVGKGKGTYIPNILPISDVVEERITNKLISI